MVRTVLLMMALVSTVSVAQTVPTADLEQVWLDPAARGSMWVGNGQTLGALQFRAGASLTYTYSQFRSFAGRGNAPLLSDRFGLQVFGALGVTDWLEFGANVPVIINQWSDPRFGAAAAGLGNPMLHGKIMILDQYKPVQLSFGVGVGIPVGTAAAQGNGGVEVLPRINLGKVYSNFQVGFELSGLIRSSVDYSPFTTSPADKVGSQLGLGVMIASVGPGLRTEVSARGFVSLAGGGRGGVEAQIGARYPIGNLELFASLGPGIFGEPSTPIVRVYAGMAFANVPMTKQACTEGRPYELADCPDLDVDNDGVLNFADACATVMGPAANKGCPDTDVDNDGVVDRLDACLDVPGAAGNKGCPWPDTDKDTLIDPNDSCPNEVGPVENKGCPDTDKDSDGVVDRLDSCVDQAGPAENKGCPWPDADADGVPDFEDNCPKEAGVKENQGCPASKKQLVIITREKLVIKDKVYFDTGRATIQKKSNALLDQVAGILVDHSEINLVQVEGHTDNVGKPEKNKTLSQDRANAVKNYLVKKGVAETRLVPMGFGQEMPADTNDTPAGRDNNRRVEFKITGK